MAAIDDLISQISDESLRERIRAEIKRANKQKKFGLVYEEHLPESTPLYDVPVKKGSIVAKKNGEITDLLYVESITDGQATCISKTTKDRAVYPVSTLVSIAQFGEPIYPYRYACQLCHKPFANVEMCQLERKPDVELDPLNLCLCPSCAQRFRELRNNEYDAQRFIDEITSLTERDISGDDYVSVSIRDMDFWFTQTHIAEIIELLRLKKQADDERKNPGSTTTVNHQPTRETIVPVQSSSQIKPVKQETSSQKPVLTVDKNEEDLQSDLSVYREYIGKRVFHKTQKVYAKVVDCDGKYFKLQFESGVKAGQIVSYSMAMCIDNGWLEIVE